MLSESEFNEVPKNMVASINTPQSITNNIGNNNNFAKIMHEATPIASGRYGADDYRSFDHPPSSILTEMSQYQQYQTSGPSSTYLPQNDLVLQQNSQQHYLTTESRNHSKLFNDHQNNGLSKSISAEESVNTNSPQMYTNTQNVVWKMDDMYKNHNESHSAPEPHLSDTKRQSLEKTITIIERILINSTNNHTKTDATCSPDETDPLAPINKNEIDKREDFIKYGTDSDDEVLIKKVETSTKRKKARAKKKPPKTPDIQSKSNTPISNTPTSKNPSENNEIKFTEEFLKLEPIDDVKVKVEHTSWPDIDYSNPFHRDINGTPQNGVGDLKVIRMENSIEEAKETIKNGASSIAYFECPHCSLLLIDPKRFLIHVKWHNFGLINRKREENARERETKVKDRLMTNNLKRIHSADASVGQVQVYPCKDCDMVFNGKSSLKNHRRKHTKTHTECKICLAPVSGLAELRKHLQTHTDKEHGYHQCPHCPKKFKYRHSLTKHADTHLEKNFSCPECSKKFGSEKLVKMHMKTHERMARGTKYHCSFCGKGFYEAYNLTVHERTHRNDKPFQCDICKSCFVTNSSLKRHLKVSHSGAKPYTCKVCHKCFATEPIRDRHEVRLHSDLHVFPYPCQLCPKQYMKLRDLKNHLYKIHPKEQKNNDSESTSS